MELGASIATAEFIGIRRDSASLPCRSLNGLAEGRALWVEEKTPPMKAASPGTITRIPFARAQAYHRMRPGPLELASRRVLCNASS